MVVEETVTPPPSEVIEAVKQRAIRYRKEYDYAAENAQEYQSMAQSSFDAASAQREKAEACEKWLDENDPEWREDFTEKELEDARDALGMGEEDDDE